MPARQKRRRYQSGRSQAFMAMAFVLWALASFCASYPIAAAVTLGLASLACVVVALSLWAYTCFRRNNLP